MPHFLFLRQTAVLMLVLLGTLCSPAEVAMAVRLKPAHWWHLTGTTNTLVQQHRRKFRVPGISVAIAQNGRLVYSEGFGYRDRERRLLATPQTRYRLASISKSVTSVIVMSLVEQGRFDLNRSLASYVPGFPEQKKVIQLKHLLSHQSGIRHYKPGDPDSLSFLYCRDAMKFFQDDALKFQPGEKYSYSTHAYTVLGAALENATEKPFRQLVIDELTVKHDLPTLRPEDRAAADPLRATLYRTVVQTSSSSREPAQINNARAEPDNISWKCPGGGLESTAPDLCRFGTKLLDRSLLSKNSLQQLWTPSRLNNGSLTRYGLGWVIGSSGEHRYVAHSGSQLGARSYLRIYPDEKIVVVILSNCSSHRPQDLGDALSKVILRKPVPIRLRLRRPRSFWPPGALDLPASRQIPHHSTPEYLANHFSSGRNRASTTKETTVAASANSQ